MNQYPHNDLAEVIAKQEDYGRLAYIIKHAMSHRAGAKLLREVIERIKQNEKQ